MGDLPVPVELLAALTVYDLSSALNEEQRVLSEAAM